MDALALEVVDFADDAVDEVAEEERAAPAGVDVLRLDESGRLVGPVPALNSARQGSVESPRRNAKLTMLSRVISV